jgi:putative salt-induced outer membrane protein
MNRLTAVALLAALAAPAVAVAEPIPAGVAAMIEAAAKDPAKLKVVADIARQTNPASAAEIDARVAEIAAAAEAARVETLSSQTFLEGWTGQGEAGGFVSTGNAEESGLALGLGLTKESLRWRHRLDAVADYRETDGVKTKERYFAGYEGNYKITDRLYAVGALSWEKDVFAGIDRRFAESLGLGYRVIDRKTLHLDVDASVAARQTEYVRPAVSVPEISYSESTIGARLGGRLVWDINENTSLSEVAVAYFDDRSNSLESTTALTTRLTGSLAARFSVNVRYESDPPLGREQTDTTTRASLVYSF